MRRFREYYRQFEEMPPEEVSLELRARRDEEKRRALSRIEPLDLSGVEWHEPPHPEAVNAATFALRRALNAYPDRSAEPLRVALAERHGAVPEQVALGHGAGELLRAACTALLAGGGDALVAWPGWQPLPGLVEAAGGRAVPVPPGPAEILDHAGAATRAVLLTSPADPTGAAFGRGAVRDLCAAVPEGAIVIVDEALGEFAPDGDDAAALVGELPNLLVVRSFSKAHAMAGLRAGAALGPAELIARLAPSGAALVAEEHRWPFPVIARSFALTRGNALPIFAFLLIVALVYLLISVVVTFVFGAALGLAGLGMAAGQPGATLLSILSGIVSATGTTIFTLMAVAIYRQLATDARLGRVFG